MNYEQMLSQHETTECVEEIRVTIILVFIAYLLVDCMCSNRRKIKKLTAENETLKTIILKSIDKTFVQFLKNGYTSDDDTE